MPIKGQPIGGDPLEHLRKGTREQYESPWTAIAALGSATFTHELGEIPWTVDVLKSEQADGRAPVPATVTVVKTETTISVVATDTGYYQVRAM